MMIFMIGQDQLGNLLASRVHQGVEILRDAMLDMWEAELGADFTPKAPQTSPCVFPSQKTAKNSPRTRKNIKKTMVFVTK